MAEHNRFSARNPVLSRLVVFCVLSAVTGGFTAVLLLHERSREESVARQELLSAGALAANQTLGAFDQFFGAAKSMTDSMPPEVIDLPPPEAGTPESAWDPRLAAIGTKMRGYFGILPLTRSFYFVNAQGRFMSGVDYVPGLDQSDRVYFKILRDDQRRDRYLSEVIFGRIAKTWVIVPAVKIRRADGSFGGVFITSIPVLKVLDSPVLRRMSPGEGGSLVIRHRPTKTIAVGYAGGHATDDTGKVFEDAGLDAATATGRDSGFLSTETTIRHFLRIPDTDYYIVLSRPKESYLGPWRADAFRTAGYAAVLLLFVAYGLALNLRQLRHREELAGSEAESAERNRRAEDSEKVNRLLETQVAERTAELSKSNDDLQSARAAADLANRLKSVFLANMSHEIRTPMNAILGYAELLRRDASLAPAHRTQVEIINRAGAHLLALINDILEMSKIEAGKSTLNPEAFDLHDLLADLVELYSAKAHSKGLSLVLERPDAVPRHIFTDSGKLRQILANLVGNAVKFTPSGGVSLVVRAKSAGAGVACIEFAVTDTGLGLTPEESASLFNAFTQATAGAREGGTGLGLAISKGYAKLMGGDIIVISEPGKGATFRLTIVAPIAGASEVVSHSEIPQVKRLVAGHREVRILVVDDNEDNRVLLDAVLRPVGFTVRFAENGKEAVEIYDAWRPEAVLMDMLMPVMDGYDACRAIRALPDGGKVYILALTASAFVEQKGEIIKAGADDFMSKPFKQDELFALLGEKIGLTFEYAGAPVCAAGVAAASTLTRDAVAALPQAERRALSRALEAADLDAFNAVCDRLDPLAPETAKALRALAEGFRYDELARLLS